MARHFTTVSGLVRAINAREQYAYLNTPNERLRVVEARTRKMADGERVLQVRMLYNGEWRACSVSEISIER